MTVDLSWLVIHEEEKRMRRECEEEGIEYEPLFSIGTLFDVFSKGKKDEDKD